MIIRTIFIISLSFTATNVWARRKSLNLRQFNAGGDVYYASKGGGYGSRYSSKGCVKPESSSLLNANMECTSSSCRVKCKRGYQMDGSRTLYIDCNSATGAYTYLDRPWEDSLPPCSPVCRGGCPEGSTCVAPNKCEEAEPECEPGFTGPDCQDFECDPPCQNGGTCIFIDVCNCAQGYAGLQCQEHRCAIPDVAPANADIGGDNELTLMEIQCSKGHQMTNGLASMTFLCDHHVWVSNDGRIPIDQLDVNCYA